MNVARLGLPINRGFGDGREKTKIKISDLRVGEKLREADNGLLFPMSK